MEHLDDLPDCPDCGTTVTVATNGHPADYRCPNDDCDRDGLNGGRIDSRAP